MSDWDDLFEAAASAATSADKESISEDRVSTDVRHRKKKKRDHKSSALSSPVRDYEARDLTKMLATRMDIPREGTSMPSWMRFGPSLFISLSRPSVADKGSLCKGWLSAKKSDGVHKEGFRRGQRCSRCRLSPMYHTIDIDLCRALGRKEAKDETPLLIFSAVRDIRCCCSVAVECTFGDGSALKAEHRWNKNDYVTVALDKAKRCILLFDMLENVPSGEEAILGEKCRSLEKKVMGWYNVAEKFSHRQDRRTGRGCSDGGKTPKMTRKSERRFLENLVQVIIACDALYYRLYYLQIIGVFPVISLVQKNPSCRGKSVCPAFIPHPPAYFSELTWDTVAGENILKIFLRETVQSTKEKRTKVALTCFYGLSYSTGSSENAGRILDDANHPLEFLHRSKFLETIFLLWGSGWAQSEGTAKELNDILCQASRQESSPVTKEEEFYSRHETPANPILSEFRNSSRDFLCNLYSYACVPSSSGAGLRDYLAKLNITDVVELGAGTGYVAHLLNENGLNVTALDLAPTNTGQSIAANLAASQNEYHGLTPSFVSVSRGDVSCLKRFVRAKSKKTALLLCYPPPLSNMAYDALQSFVSMGGECLVHIGEFMGLTGSRDFEDLLLNKFHCAERLPCLEWGTDAASISIWVRRSLTAPDNTGCWKGDCDGEDSSSSVLLPCSNCLGAAAIKRCRFARSIVYCGQECFDLHTAIRDVHLALNMVFIKCDFRNACHFSTLDTHNPGTIKAKKTIANPNFHRSEQRVAKRQKRK